MMTLFPYPPRVDHNPRTPTQRRPRLPRNHNHCHIITATADTNTARRLWHWLPCAIGLSLLGTRHSGRHHSGNSANL
ncbi:MAG: hypothetical protein AAF639_29235 [Chloroflexota bacterium]